MARTRSLGIRARTAEMIANDVYHVQEILEEWENEEGGTEYLVWWMGYSARDATWEPAENISAPDIARWRRHQDE
ncbi:hypothetical protein LTR37_013816, partial [Vermiconidia calcicola]